MTVTTILPEATPRSLEVLLESARGDAECPHPHCGAQPGQPCRWQGVRGVHLARFVRLYVLDLMTADEFAVVLGGLDVFTEATIIRDGAR